MKCEWGTKEGQPRGYCNNKALKSYRGQVLCGKHFRVASTVATVPHPNYQCSNDECWCQIRPLLKVKK